MSIYYPGCAEITPPVCSDCPEIELGRVRGFALIKKTFAFTDITNPVEWTSGLCSDDIIIYPKSRGTMEFAPQIENGFGSIPQELTAYDITVKVMEPNLIGNFNHWNSIKKSKDYTLAVITETLLYKSDNEVMIVPSYPIGEDPKSRVVWNIEFKFTQENLPVGTTKPVGIFDACIACT